MSGEKSSGLEGQAGPQLESSSQPGPYARLARRRRPLLTALAVCAAAAVSILTKSPTADVLDPTSGWRFWAAWFLMVLGAGIRIWGSGNLRKNQEITRSGVYVLVRHPLYLGSLSFLLAFFITVGNPIFGAILFVLLTSLVFYPTMLSEENQLKSRFAAQYQDYRPPPRFIPDLRRLPEAMETDRFRLQDAWGNLGLRSLWFFVALPVVLWLVRVAQNSSF